MNGEFFESMGNEEFNLPTTNGGHATAKKQCEWKASLQLYPIYSYGSP